MKENILNEINSLILDNKFEKFTKEKLHKRLLENKNIIPAYLQCFDVQVSDIKNFQDLLEHLISQERYCDQVEISDYVPEKFLFVKRTNRKRPKQE